MIEGRHAAKPSGPTIKTLYIHFIKIYSKAFLHNIVNLPLSYPLIASSTTMLVPLFSNTKLIKKEVRPYLNNVSTVEQPDATAFYRKSNFQASCMEGLRIIFGDENILLLGTIQV
jgi:hypothetical protein